MEVLVNSHVIVAAHVCFCLISTECLCRCPPSIASSKFLSHNMDIHQEVCLRKYSQLFEKPPIYYLRQMCSIGVFFYLSIILSTVSLSAFFFPLLPVPAIPSHFAPLQFISLMFCTCVHSCAGCVLFLRALNVFFLHNSVFFFFNSANMTASIFVVSTLLFGGFQSFFLFFCVTKCSWHFVHKT